MARETTSLAAKVFDGGSIFFHEALPQSVSKDASFSPGSFAHQYSERIKSGRMKLNEFHVLKRNTQLVREIESVSRVRKTIGSGLVDFSETSCGQKHRFGVKKMKLSCREVIGHDPLTSSFFEDEG